MAEVTKHFQRLRGVYRAIFFDDHGRDLSPAGREVLANLKQLTSYGSSPFRSDPVAMAYAVGQQDVVRHILQVMNVSDEEIYRLTSMISDNREDSIAYDN